LHPDWPELRSAAKCELRSAAIRCNIGAASFLVTKEYQRVRTRAAAAISIPAAPTPMAVIAIIYDLSAMSLTF
jgi:hypothetical protein